MRSLNQLGKLLVRFGKKLRNKIQRWLCKAICTSGLHTQPRWVYNQQYHTAVSATYYGECRSCKVKLTPEYSFSDFSGPLYEGIEEYSYSSPIYRQDREVYTVYKYKSRDLEHIIEACVNMFIKDLPTNVNE